MRDTPPWTIPFGRWGGVPVRLHLFFVLVATSTLYLSWLAGQSEAGSGALWLAILAIAIFTFSVALHVAGHVYAVMQLGTAPEIFTIGPFGEFADFAEPINPKSQLTIALAGPAVNLLVAIACLPGLFASGQVNLGELLIPCSPVGLMSGATWLVALKLTLWINWTLAVVNLLPARPFDGSQCALFIGHVFYPLASRRRIALFVQRLGWATGLTLVIAAILFRDAVGAVLIPPWFLLLTTGLLILFTAQRKLRRPSAIGTSDDELFGYDFSQGYTSLERSHARVEEAEEQNGPLERWLETRREARQDRQHQLEAEEDKLVDEILARVHQHGLQGLSDDERALLERVSMRYRTRMD